MSVKKLKDPKDCGPRELPYEVLYPVRVGGGRKYRRKKFRTRREADAFDREAHQAMGDVNAVDPSRAEKMTVGELHREYMDHLRRSGGRSGRGAAGSSLEAYDNIYRSTIEPRWGSSPLTAVTSAAVRDWVETGEFPSEDRKRAGVRQFSRLIGFADGRHMNGNPVKPFLKTLPKSEASDVKRHALTLRQVFRLAACAPAHYSDMFIFLSLTGLRYGELAALRGRDVDGNSLLVRRTQRTVGGRVEYADVTKSGERRSVPLTRVALDIAEARRRGRDDHLFTAPKGGDLSYQNFVSRGLKPALSVAANAVERLQAALGISEYAGDFHVFGHVTASAVEDFQQANGLPVTGVADPALREAVGLSDHHHDYTLAPGDSDFDGAFTPHGFRHSAVSLVVAAGASVKLAQRFAGHASAAMTLDVYSHLFDEDLEAVADTLGRLVGEARVASDGPVLALPQ